MVYSMTLVLSSLAMYGSLEMKIENRTMVDSGIEGVKMRSIQQNIPKREDRQSIASDKIPSRPTSVLVRKLNQ